MTTIELFSYKIDLEAILALLCIGLIINFTLLLFISSRIRNKQSTRSQSTNISESTKISATTSEALTALESQLPRTAIHRYNPFRDSGVGGNQSFSLAMVNSLGSGVIITHLYSRELSRVSVKDITEWKSDLELSPEEQEVLAKLK